MYATPLAAVGLTADAIAVTVGTPGIDDVDVATLLVLPARPRSASSWSTTSLVTVQFPIDQTTSGTN